MTPYPVVFRPAAIEQLDSIEEYVFGRSLDARAARTYVARIEARCKAIGQAPFGGAPRDDLEPGLRMIAVERRAVILYRIVEDVVEITNVFHGGRDYARLFRR